MLELDIKPLNDFWDEKLEMFITIKEQTIRLEHSLVSISKWESKWHKPFLAKNEKTDEEIIDYIKCMTLTQNVDPLVYLCLSEKNLKKVNDYITDPMTATWFNNSEKKRNNEIITSELIYYWMIDMNIPVEFQKWHINRLMTLIKICDVKNNPKKMSRSAVLSQQARLNAERKAKLNSKG